MTDETVPVIFRAERSGDFKGHVTAVFPTVAADHQGWQMTCYAHVGQHGSCDRGWYDKTRPAKPEEYRDLLKELRSIGYKLKIVRRISRAMRDGRHAQEYENARTIVATRPCPKCGARLGQWCVLPDGRNALDLHPERSQ